MKKLSLIVAVALGTLVACNLAMAQDASKEGGKKGKRGGASLEQLKTALSLTDEQVPKVKTVLEERNKKVQELMADTSIDKAQRGEKFKAIQEETTKKMKGILTDDQYKKYQEMHSGMGKKGGKKKTEPKAEQ